MRSRGSPSPSRRPRTRRRAGTGTPRGGRDPLPPPCGQSGVRAQDPPGTPPPGAPSPAAHGQAVAALLPPALAGGRPAQGHPGGGSVRSGGPDGRAPPRLPAPSSHPQRPLSTFRASSSTPASHRLSTPAGISPSLPPSVRSPIALHSPLPGLTPNPGTSSAFSCPAPRWGWPAPGGSCPGCHLQDQDGGSPPAPHGRGAAAVPAGSRGVSPSLCRWGRAKLGELSELGQDLGEGGPASPSWHQASVRGR